MNSHWPAADQSPPGMPFGFRPSPFEPSKAQIRASPLCLGYKTEYIVNVGLTGALSLNIRWHTARDAWAQFGWASGVLPNGVMSS